MAPTRIVEYVNEVYETFKQNRQSVLEETWDLAWDAFVAKYSEANLAKWRALEGYDWRSKVFIRHARRKVLSSIAQINDIQFQAGQYPFNLTPSNDMIKSFPTGLAEQRCSAMVERIKSVLAQQKYERTVMATNLECAIYGMSVHKSPVLRSKRMHGYQFQIPPMAEFLPDGMKAFLAQRFGRHVYAQTTQYLPIVEHVPLWDYFWDMEAPNDETSLGDIQRVKMDSGTLRKLEELPGYDPGAIQEVLATYRDTNVATSKTDEGPSRENLSKLRRAIEVIEFRGRVPIEYLDQRHEAVLAEGDINGREVEVITVIAYPGSAKGHGIEIMPAQPNLLPCNDRGFHKAYWETLPGCRYGIGLIENVQDSQMMQNGFWRCFIDNSALSSNIMRFYKSGMFKPGQDMSLRPGASFELEDMVRNVSDAVMMYAPPYIGDGIIKGLNIAERIGDEDSGHPKIMQGETAKQQPDTAYEMSQLISAANKQIGQIIKNIDEGHIEPDIEALYHYYMQTEQDESLKGNFECQAIGFSSFNDRVRKGASIQRLFGLFMTNPQTAQFLKIDPNMREIYKLSDLDPDQFMLNKEEQAMQTMQQQQIAQAMAMVTPPTGREPAIEQGIPPEAEVVRGNSMIQVPG